MIKNTKYIYTAIVFTLFLFAAVTSLFAQEEVVQQRLIKGKMWISCLPNGALEKDMSTRHTWLLAYPGNYEADNEVAGGWDATRIFNVAQLNGENIGWEYRNRASKLHVGAKVQNTLTQNYNMVDPTQPEEYMEGIIASFQKDRKGQRHMAYELQAKTMAWSLPRYDDFILVSCKLTNVDDVTFENFYYARTVTPRGPSPGSHSYESEYLWDDEVSDDIGFIFYDDTSWPPDMKGDSTLYSIHPGDISGDRGNPGNIEVENSRDRQLYNPYLYAFSFCPHSLTPNKDGVQKVWRTILSTSVDAPDIERYPGHDAMSSWLQFTRCIGNEQPRMSWRQAHAQYQEDGPAGSRWERSPRYIYAIGPYDIAPGESIEWIEIMLAGQMDRNITVLGDTTATLHFVEEGLKNLKENWNAAKELIDHNFAVPGNIPPPTAADIPLMGFTNELLAESGSGTVNGMDKAGVYLTFDPVHTGYTDPLTGEADFAGYNIYQSIISIDGPWKLVNTIPVEEADKYIDGGKMTFFQLADISIPYRYGVTTFDKDGNESALTAYILDAVTAQAFSTNNLEQIRVVPNPFRQESGFANIFERKRLAFINIPEKCSINIFTLALDLVRTIEHDGGGEETWGSTTTKGNDYLLTDFAMNVSPGIYIYHIESHVAGHEGESKTGKIFIIK